MMTIFQNAGTLIEQDKGLSSILDDLPFPVEEYNMKIDNKSTFLDIGSGFGKPVFHAAMQTGCESYGVEIVPARVSFCEDQKYTFEDYYNKLRCPKKSARQAKTA